jgi:hypothetical protein
MMINKKIVGLFLFLLTFEVFSQSNTDLQGRFISAVDYKFAKKWTTSFEYRYALDNDFSEFRNSALETGIKYDILKKLSFETRYRFTTSYQNDSHLLFAIIRYKKNISKRFSLKSNTRYEFRTQSFDSDFMQYFKTPRQFLREKITLEYNIPKSKASLYIAPEIFLQIDDENNPFFSFDRMRYNAGIDYSLKYGSTLGLGFFYEDLYNPRKNDRIVITTKYSLSIDDLVKKIKKNKKKANKKNKEENLTD